MSRYTNGWEWSEGATEEQQESAANQAMVAEIAKQIAQLYEAIPDPEQQDAEANERLGDYLSSLEDKEAEAYLAKRKLTTELAWNQIEFLEAKLGECGAVLKEDYAHHNEMADMVRRSEEG